MKQKLEQKGGEQKKENVIGKVVSTFFAGDYKEFKRRVKISLESKEFVPGSGAFLRSVFEQTRLSVVEFNECQKAIRIELGRIKKEQKGEKKSNEKKIPTKEVEVKNEDDSKRKVEDAKKQDKIITDRIRKRIMQGAIEKEQEDETYIRNNGLDDPMLN